MKARRRLFVPLNRKNESGFSIRRCLWLFTLLIFLCMCFMVLASVVPSSQTPATPIDLSAIKNSIENKDVSELLSNNKGHGKISDTDMAAILNRNFEKGEQDDNSSQKDAKLRGEAEQGTSAAQGEAEQGTSAAQGEAEQGTSAAQGEKRINGKRVVAYAITVTKDGPFVDGALVLGYAAKRVHDSKKGFDSPYEADLVAFVTKSVVTSRPILEKFGWKVIEKSVPVALHEIENQEYAEKMKNSGCCGADEFLKLWAYTLTEYHRVVHLDMDSIIYKSMDDLYRIDKEMLFTGDYNMGTKPVPPAQGGFLVIRPSIERFKEYQAIIRRGDWGGKGWGGSGIGKFWGGQTIQGIVPYFYHSIHPGDAQEMNRCIYNCMVDNPYRKGTTNCLDMKPTCEDCRAQKIENIVSAHFTICQKPWTCTSFTNPKNKVLCEQLHVEWFKLRDEFETSLGLDNGYRKFNKQTKYSMGMCRKFGDNGYLPLPVNEIKSSVVTY